MHKVAKDTIHDLTLKLRKTLEAEVERELGRYGIYPKRAWIDPDDLPRLSEEERDVHRPRIEAAIHREQEAGLNREDAVRAFTRETAYTHMNRLLGLKCMEVRGLIKETITTRDIYSGRSERHRDYLDEHPRAVREPDRGLVAVLQEAYEEVSRTIGVLFDPNSEYSIVWPRHTIMADCIQWINDVDSQVAQKLDEEPEDVTSVYRDDTILGWVYQYFQEEERKRVFEELDKEGKKISGHDIIPATSLYTERYMVQFLIENSLGALWMEMHPESDLHQEWGCFVENSRLQDKDGLEYAREPKPVADITLLDSACGSGHFLLYAFSLFARMYEKEAEIRGQNVDRRKVARDILRHNLYGIDIDLRSIQLSALSLYMKACEYAGARLEELQNGHSMQVNLVCADIVLHEGQELTALLERFKDDRLAQDVIRLIWRSLQHARELGSLIRIREPLEDLVARKRAKEKGAWFERPTEMWEQWKADLLQALKALASHDATQFDVNQRMFGQEAEKGVALTDLLTHRYDVVATNPPYAGYTGLGDVLKDYLEAHYEEGKVDLFAAFMMRCLEFTRPSGKCAMVTQQSFMFLPSFSELRELLLDEATFKTLAHLGPRAFESIKGEKVNTVLIVAEKGRSEPNVRGVYFNLKNAEDKRTALTSITSVNPEDLDTYLVNQDTFRGTEGSPLQYWTSPQVLALLKECPQLGEFCDVKTGMRLSHKEIWTRLHWEIPQGRDNPRWVPYARGGEVRRWYGNLEWLLDWSQKAQQEYERKKYHRNRSYYFQRGLTWTDITSREFSLRYLPEGCVFDVGGPTLFPETLDFWYVLGFLNTKFTNYVLNKLNATFHYYISDLKRVPVRVPDQRTQNLVGELAREACEIQAGLLEYNLTDPDFNTTALEKWSSETSEIESLQSIFTRVVEYFEGKLLHLLINRDCIEHHVSALYQLSEKDQAIIFREEGKPVTTFPVIADHTAVPDSLNNEAKDYLDSMPVVDMSVSERDDLVNSLRRLYIDESKSIRAISTTLEINPISVVALRREHKLMRDRDLIDAVEDFLANQILRLCKHDEDGIIPYDSGLKNQALLSQVQRQIEISFGAGQAVTIEAELNDMLGRGGIKGWLENRFFSKHVSQFQQRPILWQLASPSHEFRILVFYHKLDRDTLPKIRGPHYLGGLLARARGDLSRLRKNDPENMKAIGTVEEYIADLAECDRLLESVIQGTVEVDMPGWASGPYRNGSGPYDPDLDDGVYVNILPLQAAGLLPYKKVV